MACTCALFHLIATGATTTWFERLLIVNQPKVCGLGLLHMSSTSCCSAALKAADGHTVSAAKISYRRRQLKLFGGQK